MKEYTEIRRDDLQKCALCGKGIMHTGWPMFWRLKLERGIVDMRAVQRQHGLELQLGNAALAQIMGPDAPLAKIIPEKEVFICEQCASESMPLLALAERLAERTEQEEAVGK